MNLALLGFAMVISFMVLITTSTAIIFYIAGALAALKLEYGALKTSSTFIALTIVGFAYSCWAFYGAGWEASLWSLAMTAAGLPIYLVMQRRLTAPA